MEARSALRANAIKRGGHIVHSKSSLLVARKPSRHAAAPANHSDDQAASDRYAFGTGTRTTHVPGSGGIT